MKILGTFFLLVLISHTVAGQIYISKEALFTFFSEAPLEDIQAESTQGVSALNIETGEVFFRVKIRSFEFEKGLMQEHFNENYLESDKYPYAEFKGKIIEKLGYDKDGAYPVTVKGVLNIHNISKEYTVKAVLERKGEEIAAQSVFKVRVADHHIKIPKLVFKNIAEVVEVRVSADYEIQNK